MAADAFKANCLAIMDEVSAKRETVVNTKHGHRVALEGKSRSLVGQTPASLGMTPFFICGE